MGEYHYVVNLDKKEFLHPHQMGQGLKFYEWCGMHCQSTILSALAWLITRTGRVQNDPRWAGNRIVITSDYQTDGIMDSIDEGGWKDVSLETLREMGDHDKEFKEFLFKEPNYGSSDSKTVGQTIWIGE